MVLRARYERMLALTFRAMEHAVDTTCGALEVRKVKNPGLVSQLVDIAASAALAGAAGVVAEIIAKRLASYVPKGFDQFKHAYQRFSNDAIKDHLKHSVQIGIGKKPPSSQEELAIAFHDAQFLKVQAAEREFIDTFDAGPGKDLSDAPPEELEALIAAARMDAQDAEIMAVTSRMVAVEWANLVARVKHGTGDWDPWAGPTGGKGAIATADAEPPPKQNLGASPTTPTASDGNVDADGASMYDAIDDDQQPMAPVLHGILEIDLWMSGYDGQRPTRFELFTGHNLGMRLGGVSAHVKGLIAQAAQVRDLKMNKVVALYDNENLNPPQPVGRFLITADGYIRRESLYDDSYLGPAAEAAQALSPGHLR